MLQVMVAHLERLCHNVVPHALHLQQHVMGPCARLARVWSTSQHVEKDTRCHETRLSPLPHCQVGYGEFQVTHSRGERADCFRQYLAPALGRSNLTVLTDAKTLRLETERLGAATVTRGVTFQVNGPDGSKHAGAQAVAPPQALALWK